MSDEIEAPGDGVRIDVRRGAPTDDELAALIAVVGEAYSAETDAAVAEEPTRQSAWQVSQRGLRQPLRRELGWSSWFC